MIEASDIVVVDDDFLSQIEAAENDALSGGKRRKIDGGGHSSGTGGSGGRVPEKIEEGTYTAALRGSKSLLWQQNTVDSPQSRAKGRANVAANNFSSTRSDGSGGGGGGGSCFNCGKLGHWSRECNFVGVVTEGNFGINQSEVDEKACPCGLGSCLVLTANTEKNPGRKFYKCPVRQENGGCGFFEWCGNMGPSISIETSSFPDLPCPCGAGSCFVWTAKSGKSVGQQFYRCPENQGRSCGFFQWCNENTLAANLSRSASQPFSNVNDASNKTYGGKRGSSCFKCGQEGHWARDCPKTSSDSSVDVGGKNASSGTCYKCGKPGHWARDCPGKI